MKFVTVIFLVLIQSVIAKADSSTVVEESSLVLVSATPEEPIGRNNYTLHEIDYIDCVVSSSIIGRLERLGDTNWFSSIVHLGDVKLDRSFVVSAADHDLIQLLFTDRAFDDLKETIPKYNEQLSGVRKTYRAEEQTNGLKFFPANNLARRRAEIEMATRVFEGKFGSVFQRTHSRNQNLSRGVTILVGDGPVSPSISTRVGYGERLLEFLRLQKEGLNCS